MNDWPTTGALLCAMDERDLIDHKEIPEVATV